MRSACCLADASGAILVGSDCPARTAQDFTRSRDKPRARMRRGARTDRGRRLSPDRAAPPRAPRVRGHRLEHRSRARTDARCGSRRSAGVGMSCRALGSSIVPKTCERLLADPSPGATCRRSQPARYRVMKRLVLVGGGHAHVEVLRRFGLRREPGVEITLISPGRHTVYSGMLPGLVAGHYGWRDCSHRSGGAVALRRRALSPRHRHRAGPRAQGGPLRRQRLKCPTTSCRWMLAPFPTRTVRRSRSASDCR